ncbi:hypothetical protein CCACVL1_26342 [Corchorus capsularis]|uniref:Uncharacterized protein n=1 Tax=Corchorus capsularis TaxID=210143 RepID=A0A1R3GF58_COCAP|nr:hypothetical protein CCACVL1_26342 [Corchorus capsularis]
MPRSGSGWFETLLNSHINVSSNGEIFSAKRRKNISTIVQTLDKVYNLDWFTSASKNECSAAVGFKWMLNQGLLKHHREIVEYFNHRGVSAIFLFRRNLLRRMVSVLANSHDRNYAKLLNGTHKSHVHSQGEAKALSSYKPIIKSTSLISDLKEVEMTVLKALEYFNSTRHMVVYYEDLVSNHTEIHCIAGRHLKLDQKSNIQKSILAKETGSTFVEGKVNLHGVNIKAADTNNIAQSPPSPPSVKAQAPPPKDAEDFRPTAPGHSPGVGHSIQN